MLTAGFPRSAQARDDECTPLHLAAAGGHKDTIRVLVMAGALLNPVVPGGWTPLHLAIQNGHRQSADFLSANGANIRQPTQFRLTPLHLAAWHGHKGIAADLLWRGAQPTARDKCGRTPMHLACWGGNGTLARMLASRAPQLLSIADADGGTPLHDAALNNRVSVISALREMKPQWNRKNKFGHTPLHEVRARRVETTRLLPITPIFVPL